MAKRVKLNQFCEKVATIATSYNGTIDYIDISAVDNKSKSITSTQTINSIEAPSRAKQLIKNGDVLVSTVRPNLNAVAYVDLETSNLLVASTGYCVLRFTEDLDARYAFYFCQSPYFIDDMVAQATGASYPAVSTSIVKSSMIPLYVKKQQQRIAAVLDKVSELIDLRKRQLAKLDELVKSQFIELFGDPVANTKGWEIKGLPDISENLDSRRVPITSGSRKAGQYPYYGASGVVDYVEEYIFDEDLLLVSEDGANLLARVTPIAFSSTGKVWVNNHAHVLRFPDKATQCYVENLLNMLDISHYVTGTAQPKLNQAKLNTIPIPAPPMELQKQYAVIVKQSDKSKFTIYQSLDKLETLKKSLMQEYFG